MRKLVTLFCLVVVLIMLTTPVLHAIEPPQGYHRDVRDFGAKGDGTTDDTAAIQAAMDAGDVYLPPGYYRVTKTLVLHEGISMVGKPLFSEIVSEADIGFVPWTTEVESRGQTRSSSAT